MRNSYTKDFEDTIKTLAGTHTLQQLVDIAINNYNYDVSKDALRQYLSKRKIRYKDYMYNKVRTMGDNIPIGTERTKPDGMVQIKIAPNKWEYKSRYLYEKHYNVKLTTRDFIIFLDGDRTNFNIDNLYKVDCRTASYIANLRLPVTTAELTKSAIIYAQSMIQLKELNNIPPKSHKRRNK